MNVDIKGNSWKSYFHVTGTLWHISKNWRQALNPSIANNDDVKFTAQISLVVYLKSATGKQVTCTISRKEIVEFVMKYNKHRCPNSLKISSLFSGVSIALVICLIKRLVHNLIMFIRGLHFQKFCNNRIWVSLRLWLLMMNILTHSIA